MGREELGFSEKIRKKVKVLWMEMKPYDGVEFNLNFQASLPTDLNIEL